MSRIRIRIRKVTFLFLIATVKCTRTEILPFCPLFFAAGRLGGGTQKTGKNIALSVFLKGGSVESAFLPHFVGCGFLGVFVRFFAFVRFFCGGLAMGVYPPKRAKPAD